MSALGGGALGGIPPTAGSTKGTNAARPASRPLPVTPAAISIVPGIVFSSSLSPAVDRKALGRGPVNWR
ncbi:hypothetical protein AN931_27805 [Mycobacterium intracellulare subsp. chimaera]|nr:hypothetical protein WU83_23350 [Mycobacterium nebraskense]KLO32111.1 hypothetical protein ABW17_29060 [Mycobacterium nebraskense]KPN44977.1 hypothetical protein AN931_27805 [Mycobacterium intracellulare subsp. chimaera]KPN45887.1 hypothetical protein AN932_25135 [Mycobacterium intracellulare subsp. chimaera]KPN46809.1 hypothetical protein AN933_25570 [Mycobacterium intracellulare subsp. chimaera]